MKLTTSLFNLAIAAIAAGGLASCTNEFSDMNPGKDGLSSIKLVKTPEVYAWSGQQTLQNTIPAPSDVITRAANPNANMWADTWDVPSPLTDDQKDKVRRYFQTHPNPQGVSINFTDFFVQQVYKGNTNLEGSQTNESYKAANGNYFDSDNMNQLCAGNYDEINNFNHGNGSTNTQVWDGSLTNPGDQNSKVYHSDMIMLMTNSSTDFFGFKTSQQNGNWYIDHFVVIPGDIIMQWEPSGANVFGMYFVGFDYEADLKHGSDNLYNGNEYLLTEVSEGTEGAIKGSGIPNNMADHDKWYLTQGADGYYSDWIVKITKAYHKGETPETPTEPKDDCDQCHHPSHNEGDCSECPEDSGCNKTQQTPNQPEDKTCDHCPHEKHVGENCPECDIATECHPAVCDKCKHVVIWDDLQGKFIHVAVSQKEEGNCGLCEEKGIESPCTDDEIVASDGEKVIGDNTAPGNTPSTPATPDKTYKHNNEVEVNLEIVDSHEDKGIKDLATKLSIHVRCATDVDIKIPVPTRYIIDSDDLYIFNEHYGKFGDETAAGYHGTHGGAYIEDNKQELIYQLGDNKEYTVKLYVEFVSGEASDLEAPFDEGYIHVYTEGINQDVINYCMLHNGDGINFEVWTYYSIFNDLDRETLKGYLNDSTIEFIVDQAKNQVSPFYYINAFGYDYVDGSWGQTNTGTINEDDCIVTPKGDYQLKYRKENNVTHLNGTPFNDIYTKGGANGDHAHSGVN